ncbi:MAG: AAA family ATPase [Endomicrobiia bacterium]
METLIPRVFKPPIQSFFLLGPRGTGKTTFLKQTYPEAIWLDLLDPENFRVYSAYPERLKELIDAYPQKKVVVIDEIQKIPALLDVVHLLIENRVKKYFILTDSSLEI